MKTIEILILCVMVIIVLTVVIAGFSKLPSSTPYSREDAYTSCLHRIDDITPQEANECFILTEATSTN